MPFLAMGGHRKKMVVKSKYVKNVCDETLSKGAFGKDGDRDGS